MSERGKRHMPPKTGYKPGFPGLVGKGTGRSKNRMEGILLVCLVTGRRCRAAGAWARKTGKVSARVWGSLVGCRRARSVGSQVDCHFAIGRDLGDVSVVRAGDVASDLVPPRHGEDATGDGWEEGVGCERHEGQLGVAQGWCVLLVVPGSSAQSLFLDRCLTIEISTLLCTPW